VKPFVLDPTDAGARREAVGAIICEEVTAGGRRIFHKGHRITPDDLSQLATVDRPLHAVRLDPDDVHEDEAGLRLAKAIAGPGVETAGPKQSRVNLIAGRRGLLRVDAARLTAMNCLYGMAIFSLPDRMTVDSGRIVAGAKIAPVAVGTDVLAEAERIAAGEPVVQVRPFLSKRVGVVTTEGLEGRVRERFEANVRRKIGWFGGEVIGFAHEAKNAGDVAREIEGFRARGAELILTGGGNTIDPLDAAIQALPRIGAELVTFGAPAHPGSMFWLAYRGAVPIFNLASCSMYAQSTSADLVLPWIMAGERVTAADVAALGHGGLLEGKEMAFRFPPYDEQPASDPA
jgi:hypothetical protein